MTPVWGRPNPWRRRSSRARRSPWRRKAQGTTGAQRVAEAHHVAGAHRVVRPWGRWILRLQNVRGRRNTWRRNLQHSQSRWALPTGACVCERMAPVAFTDKGGLPPARCRWASPLNPPPWSPFAALPNFEGAHGVRGAPEPTRSPEFMVRSLALPAPPEPMGPPESAEMP